LTRILVVEDELAVADVIELSLRRGGFEVEVVHGRRAAELRLEPGRFAAVILDLGLPDGDGAELCRWVRGRADDALNSLPIVILTARDEELDRVLALEQGADDYVVKPFSPRELVARVGSLLRRASGRFGKDPEIVAGPLSLNRVRFRATVDGQPVPLTKTEFELLWTLFDARERVFTREILVTRVYQGARISSRTVDSHIKGIRQKCLSLNPHWDPIETVYGVGYKARTT
jgi:two-component system, OmpR family, response regulator